MSPDEGAQNVTLDPRKTLIPIGVFCAAIGAPLFYIGSMMSERLSKLEDNTSNLTTLVAKIDQRLEIQSIKSSDRWTGSDTRVLLSRWKALNPQLDVPDCADLLGDDR